MMQGQVRGRVVNRRPLSRRLVRVEITHRRRFGLYWDSYSSKYCMQVFLELERDQEQDLELLLKGSSDPVCRAC